jgi:hypothetical protein
MGNYYILIWRDTDYWLCGPFKSCREATDWAAIYVYGWGRGDQDKGDPRWHTIQLRKSVVTSPPKVVAPCVNIDSGVMANYPWH